MTDLVTGNGVFKTKNGWSESKTQRLVDDVINLLGSIPTKNLCAFGCSIDTKAHKRLVAEGYRITAPAVICAEQAIGRLFHWFTENHPFELSHLFYDQNESFIKSIRRRWLMFNDPRKVTTDLFWGRIANVQPVSMKDTPGIQAADVIAWAFTRRLRSAPKDKWAGLANVLIGSRGHPGVLTATQLDPIREDFMRRKYPKK